MEPKKTDEVNERLVNEPKAETPSAPKADVKPSVTPAPVAEQSSGLRQIYITGNFIDDEGVGHHGEILEVNEWMANKLIEQKHAITREDYEKQQAEAAARAAVTDEVQIAAASKKQFRVIAQPNKGEPSRRMV